MTHVLHVTQPVDGGVGRVVFDVADGQQQLGLRVTVASPAGWLPEQLRTRDVPWVQWNAVRAPGADLVGELRRFAAVVRAVRPDVVHLHSSKAGLVGRLHLRGSRPTLFTPHGWSWQAVAGPVARATIAWERYALRWTSLLVCVSDAEVAAGRERGVSPRRDRAPVVVRPGVDLSVFRPADVGEQARTRARFGIGERERVALCVGRLNEQKGQAVLVAGWPRVVAQVSQARLVLVGEGPLRDDLEASVRRLGIADNVSFVPPNDDIADWYRAADVVVVASRHGEAMPLTPLEAAACGRPVVATDVAGIRESVSPDVGAVVAPDDAERLAEAVARRLADPALAEQEGQRSRVRAERLFDARDATRRLAELTVTVAQSQASSDDAHTDG